jgi:secreted trypsin-like serine protease
VRGSLARRLLKRGAMLRNTIFASAVFVSLSFAAIEVTSSSIACAGTLDSPVVGGITAKPGAWPDAVAVLTRDGGLCTGTLLDADLVLTAGHCAAAEPVRVIQGSVDLSQPGGNSRAVKWSKTYPAWETSYDVGIVMLENPLAAPKRAVAEGCSERNQLASGSMLDIVGFGLTTTAGVGDNTRLHQAKIGVTDGDCTREPACERSVAPGGEFVAGGHGVDSCFGDSGGPVYITTAHGTALIGVVSRGVASYGQPCGDGGIYVRADKVVQWIEKASGRLLDRMGCEVPGDNTSGGSGDGSADGKSDVDGGELGGCSAGGEAVGGAGILFVLTLLWLLTWNRARKAR